VETLSVYSSGHSKARQFSRPSLADFKEDGLKQLWRGNAGSGLGIIETGIISNINSKIESEVQIDW
jgi:hypothetical protein